MLRGAALTTKVIWALLMGCAACGSKPAPAPHAVPTPPAAQLEEEPAPSHDPFEQPEDAPLDTKALLDEMRHDCCTELPAAEVEKHRDPPSTGRQGPP